MAPKYIQMISIAAVVAAYTLIAFLYWTEPRSFTEVATKGQVATGTYSIDKAEAERGIQAFRAERYEEARAAFQRSDPERRDANVQFYIAYSYYRQGWGRLYNDDELFTAGIRAIDRVLEIDPGYRSQDATLGLKTPADLKHELDEGLKLTASDLNPLKLTRERK